MARQIGNVFGKGYNTLGVYTPKVHKTYYAIWKAALARSYYYNEEGRSEVCQEWLDFQKFCLWIEKEPSYKEGYSLDKDILVLGNRTYGPDVCVFVPQQINKAFSRRINQDSSLPLGVAKSSANKYKVRYYDEYGVRQSVFGFDNPEEASLYFIRKREETMRLMADVYKDEIDERVYLAMKNYKVIT